MRIAVVLLTSGLLLVATSAFAENCASCGGGYAGAELAGYGYGGGCGNAYGNCDYASSLWTGYCSEPTWCGGCGKMGGLFGKLCGKCGGASACDPCACAPCACSAGCNTWWYGYGAGPCGCAKGCGLGCGTGCGGGCGWMDKMRARFACRGWRQGVICGADCVDPCAAAPDCYSDCGTQMSGCAGDAGVETPVQTPSEVDSWQGSSFDYSTETTTEAPKTDNDPFYQTPATSPESTQGEAESSEELPGAEPDLNDA